jgi:hypothetical protein
MMIEQFKTTVARRLRLAPEAMYGKSLKLSEVVARSPIASNSIDLVEAVAGAMAELGIDDQVDLPAITLDNSVDDLVREVERQLREANLG